MMLINESEMQYQLPDSFFIKCFVIIDLYVNISI